MADLWGDFWERETGTGQQVAQIHDGYMMMMIKEIRCKFVELAQGMDKWQAVVCTVMNFSGFSKLCTVSCIT